MSTVPRTISPRTSPMPPARTLLLTLCALALTLPACVRRSILVTSDPPGATVFLNDQQVGTTPCETDFRFYGTYDVRLTLDGYQSIVTSETAQTPLHEQPGLDLVAAPFPFNTRIAWHYVLEKKPEAVDRAKAEPALIQRGRDLGARVTPPSPTANPSPTPASTPAP